MNNDREDAIATALCAFNDLGHSVTPTFLSRKRFYLQWSTHCPKMNKNRACEDFCAPDIRILPSCDCKVRETIIGPLKQYLAENISLQRSNCNILELTGTVPLSANEARFFQIYQWYFSGHVYSKTKSVTPNFYLFGKSRSLPFCVASLK